MPEHHRPRQRPEHHWPGASPPGTLIVTGASNGIGAAVATRAAAAGWSVAVNHSTDRAGAERVLRTVHAGGGRAVAVHADIADEDDVLRLFAEAEAQLGGPVRGLVNNAGVVGRAGRVDELDAATLRRTMDVNVVGLILCAREAVRRMSTRNGGTGGAIVNVSSRAAHTGAAGEWVHYAASKAAVDGFTNGLAREVADEGVRVNCVAPGLVDTGLHAGAGLPDRVERMASTVPMLRAGDPHEVAEAVVWLLSPAASYVTGAVVPVSGGR